MIADKKTVYKMYTELSVAEQSVYQEKIFRFLKGLSEQYPGFCEWYHSLFFPSHILKPGREIIFCEEQDTVIGAVILKKDVSEKKICTLRVDDRFRGQGIGTCLLRDSIRWLKCDRPLITVSGDVIAQYKGLFRHFDFIEEDAKYGYYRPDEIEYVFNGVLE